MTEDHDQTMNNIVKWLNHYGANYLRISCTTKVDLVGIFISSDKSKSYIETIIEGKNVRIDGALTVCIRRGYICMNNVSSKFPDTDISHWLDEEALSIIDFLYFFLENRTKYCLGSLTQAKLNKLIQLDKASACGFKIANTYVITPKYNITKLKTDSFITKPISDISIHTNGNREFFTGGTFRIDTEKYLNDWEFPSLLQQFLDKSLEIRVFFYSDFYYALGRRSYDARYTRRADWRRYNANFEKMRFFPVDLPRKILVRLKELSKALNINTGSYDLILFKNEYYFLEVNTHGQFGFVSSLGNYQIEKDIADFLNTIDKDGVK